MGSTLRFPFAFEENSSNRASTFTAREHFLDRISEIRPNVISDLLETAYPHLVGYLDRRSADLASLLRSIEEESTSYAPLLRTSEHIYSTGLRRLIPDRRALENDRDGAALREAIDNWGRENNLTDTWCLDQSLAFLRAFHTQEGKRYALALLPYTGFLKKLMWLSWIESKSQVSLNALYKQFETGSIAEEKNLYAFEFHHEEVSFSVSGPFYRTMHEFKDHARKAFIQAGGAKTSDARKEFEKALSEYLGEIERFKRELQLQRPPLRVSKDHFDWLVNYQIPPYNTYRAIARAVHKQESTVREGIRTVANLIGLTLRSSTGDRGRPKGSKDKQKRRRVSRN